MDISKIATKDLVEELSKRNGVEAKELEPHKEESISVCGPVIVLIITD